MRRRTDQSSTVWNAQVDAALLKDVERRLPVHGIRTYLIVAGLKQFLEEVRHSPSAQKVVHEDIQFMLHSEARNPSSVLQSINVRIPTQDYIEFNELFPEWGGASWFMRRFLQAFNSELESRNIVLGSIIESCVAPLYRNNRPAVYL